MKIYFPKITFNNVPLVWDYDEKTNKATCTFLTTEKVVNSHAVLRELSSKLYPGITLTLESAIIEDFTSFAQAYPSKPLLSKSFGKVPLWDLLPEKEAIVHSTDSKELIRGRSISVRAIQESRSVGLISSIGSSSPSGPISPRAGAPVVTVKEKLPRSTSGKSLNFNKSKISEKPGSSPYSLFERPKNMYESILLDDLIVKQDDPGLWGDTVGYKRYFTEKTEQDRSERSEIYLRNESSFYKEHQYLLNDNICPFKSEIIILIEQVLKKELDPAYQEWIKEQGNKLTPQILKALFKYLSGAVLNTMTNESFNKEPTEYELLSEEERYHKFHGNMPRYQAANLEIRKARARLMMMDWLVLFDESYPLESGSIDTLSTEAIRMLVSFKEYLTKDPHCVQRLTKLFHSLEALLVKSGEIERDNKKLTDELRAQLADKTMSIGDYSSLCSTVRIFLAKANQSLGKKHALPDILCHKIAQQVVCQVIKLLAEDAEFKQIPHIATIRSSDSDLYLNKDWMGAISDHLGFMPWDKIAKKALDSQKDIENMHWEKIVSHLMESKTSAARLKSIADKIFQCTKMKGTILLSQKLTDAEETNSAFLEENAGDPEDRQTFNL